MTNELAALGLVGDIKAHHREIQRAGKVVVSNALDAGRLLIRAKADCPHGEWESFVEEQCGFSMRTAQHYMKAARDLDALPKSATIALLKNATDLKTLLDAVKEATPKPPPKREGTKRGGDGRDSDRTTTPELAGSDQDAGTDDAVRPEADADYGDEQLVDALVPAKPIDESGPGDVECSRCSGSGRVPITAKMPAALSQSAEFVNAWQDYQLFRIQKRSKLTTVGISRLFKKLESWGPEKATKALEITMENGWTGVFEPDQKDRASDDPRGNMATLEAYIAQL